MERARGKKTMKKIVILTLIIVIGILLFFEFPKFIGWIAFYNWNPCKDKVVKEIRLPQTDYKLVAFIRDCGATTDFSTHVSVIGNGQELPKESGNIFSGNHSRSIDIELEDINTLIVRHDCKEQDVYKKENKFKLLAIKYKPN